MIKAVVAVAIGVSGANASVVTWHAGDGGNGHAYELVHAAGGISWEDARATADSKGGYLATLTSSAENQFVFDELVSDVSAWNGDYGPWIGGFQTPGSAEPDSGWAWITGESWTFTNWYAGEPSNTQGIEAYLHFIATDGNGTPSPQWNDFPLDGFGDGTRIESFVVEYDVPTPASSALIVLGAASLAARRRSI